MLRSAAVWREDLVSATPRSRPGSRTEGSTLESKETTSTIVIYSTSEPQPEPNGSARLLLVLRCWSRQDRCHRRHHRTSTLRYSQPSNHLTNKLPTGRSGAVLPHPAAPPSPPRPRRPGPGQLRPGGPTPAPPSSVLDVPGPARGEGSGGFCFSTITATISTAEHGAQGGERRISMKKMEICVIISNIL